MQTLVGNRAWGLERTIPPVLPGLPSHSHAQELSLPQGGHLHAVPCLQLWLGPHRQVWKGLLRPGLDGKAVVTKQAIPMAENTKAQLGSWGEAQGLFNLCLLQGPRQPKVMPQVWRRKPRGFYWSVYTCVFLCVSCGCFCVWMYVQTHSCVSTGLLTCSWYAGADRMYGGCGENLSSWLAEWEGRQAWC